MTLRPLRKKRPGPGRPNDLPNALATRIVKMLEAEPDRSFRAGEISAHLGEEDRELVLRAALRSLHNAARIWRIERGLYQAVSARRMRSKRVD